MFETRLQEFIESSEIDIDCLELLMFFGRHPQLKFNRSALINVAGHSLTACQKALNNLVKNKIVIRTLENGMPLYSLTKTEPEFSFISRILELDRNRRQSLVEGLVCYRP
jgi:hypothetical protein